MKLMTFVEKREVYRANTGEAPFALNDTFFTRTDERGVICAANYTFKRISGFEWNEIIGAPHRVVRHADMPKGVFWLLWNTIKKGEPMGAYVKNKTKDGLYYWVFAVVTPVEGGFLSVRIKPSSTFFETIQSEYTALLKAEHDGDITPEESAARLLSRIKEMGFDDYEAFAAFALSEELNARDEGLEAVSDKNIGYYRAMLENAKELTHETAVLTNELKTMKIIPANMRVIASRLEPTGGAISTLSQNYGSVAQEIFNWFEQYVANPNSNFAAIKRTIEKSMFLECSARILIESANEFDVERRDLGGIDLAAEKILQNNLALHYTQNSALELLRVSAATKQISNAAENLQRQVSALSAMQVMCKIEKERLPEAGERLTGVIEQLDAFQIVIKKQLFLINGHSNTILDRVRDISKG